MKETASVPLAHTRSEVILHYVHLMVRETAASIEDYSEDVLRIWLERTPESARSTDFSTLQSVFDRMKVNGQKIRRWMNPAVSARPSMDVEEALVLALPAPYQMRCLRELADRYRGLFVELPEGAVTVGVAGELLAGVGETCKALAPVLADNQINADDREESLLNVRAAVLGMQAKAAGILHEVDAALDQQRVRRRLAEAVAKPVSLRSVR